MEYNWNEMVQYLINVQHRYILAKLYLLEIIHPDVVDGFFEMKAGGHSGAVAFYFNDEQIRIFFGSDSWLANMNDVLDYMIRLPKEQW